MLFTHKNYQTPEKFVINVWKKQDIFAIVFCCIVGVILSILPHLAVFFKFGTFEYLADGDDVLYLAITKAPYYGEWLLRDPFTRPSDSIPTLYSWLQFVPIAKLASWLGVPLILVPIVWRILGGVFFGLSLYILFRLLFQNTKRSTFWAFICTIICLCDGGFIGRSFLENFINLKSVIHNGVLPNAIGNAVLPQYRIVTPLLNLPFLLLLSCLFLPVVRRNWQTALVGGILLGSCIHLYFFYWTAAFIALTLYGFIYLFLGWRGIISRERCFHELWFVGLILLGGLIIGFPQITSNSVIFSKPEFKPILERMSRGAKLFLDDPFRRNYIVNLWTWMHLIVGAIAIFYFRHFNLVIISLMTFSSYLLLNSAIVTGLEFENYHWNYVNRPFGEILLLGSLVLIFQDKMIFDKVIKVLVIAILITGVWGRTYEALHATEPVQYTKTLEELKPLRSSLSQIDKNSIIAGSFEANVASLFTKGGQLFQFNQTSHSSVISDTTVLERHALNAWLLGYTLNEYKNLDIEQNFTVGHAYLKPIKWQPESIRKVRIDIFESILSGKRQEEILIKYSPNYLLLSSEYKPVRGGIWTIFSSSKKWILWTKI
ncbi:hypothetical protein QUB80_21545 [Chlorogloeopsis sp. ULAP01]|uniref:hypothetical protein n=1 Tax=Chlorogloeopsis sp. ULAP01 TaxID=3056483 RepID=UPI0025AAB17E|nr:hypothetical protein [Chlorogloeopsis sp. ULAP01]MDM9383279.1 hypothetical protein [Chlorogloeopsis sp. ULAP01]